MKKITVLLVALLTALNIMAADPDFAYPKTKLDKAVKAYDEAINDPAASGIQLIRCVLQITRATAAIDQDSLVRVIPRIDRAITAMPDGPDKALMLTARADVLNAIYSRNRWKYDQSETPDEPLPADITEWNGRQFTAQIQSALTSSFGLATAHSCPISHYTNANIIKADRQTQIYFPDVASFVAFKASRMFRSLALNDNSHAIITRMIALSPEKSAPWFYWSAQLCNANELSPAFFSVEDKGSTTPLHKLYLDNKDCEEAGYILALIADQNSGYNFAPSWLLPELRSFISRYPAYWQINDLKNCVANLTQSCVSLSIGRTVAPGQPIKVGISQLFTKKYGFNVYSLTAAEFNRGLIKVKGKKPLQRISVANTANAEKTDTTLTFTLAAPGYYAVAATVNDSVSNSQATSFICSTFYPVLLDGNSTNAMLVTDLTTGAPVSGVSVTEHSDKTKTRQLGKSDKKGIIKFAPLVTDKGTYRSTGFTFSNARGSIKFPGLSYMSHWRRENQPDHHAIIFCDRQLYHPGDTIRWAAVASYGEKIGEAAVCPDLKLRVNFNNVNAETIDSVIMTTDEFGRISGSFVAPEDGLTGEFEIEVYTVDADGDADEVLNSRGITVSDFKLPTFKIDSLTAGRDLPTPGCVTLGGLAVTYSGMPVSGAKVEATIWEASRWRWFSRSRKLAELSATTGPDGRFSVVVPDSVIKQSDTRCFIAEFSVAAQSGEVQTASKPFTTGKPYSISFDNNESIVNLDSPLKDPFSVYDADGKEVDIMLRWWLNEGKTEFDPAKAVASGTCSSSAGSSIDLSDVPAGIYRISAAPVDTALADNAKGLATLRLYSIGKNTMPDEDRIFIPTSLYTTDDKGHVEVIFGTPDDNTYIYKVVASPGELLSLDQNRYDKGFHRAKVSLPDTCTNATFKLITVRDGKLTQESILIQRPDRRKITLEGSSMRDRLTSGTDEHWTIKLTDADKHPVAGALIATMFNSALNSLTSYRMPSDFFLNHPMPFLRISSPANYLTYSNVSLKINLLKGVTLVDPVFNPSIDGAAIGRYGYIGMRSMANAAIGSSSADDLDEVVAVGYGTSKKSMLTGAVAGVAYDEAEEESEIALNETVTVDGGAETKEDFDYRDGEVLQALWMPGLVIGDNGETEITFTVPNANTTWSFNAFAWTSDLRAAKMMREFVTSKPVMVQPNLPRFLRVGDKARVLATVYNNSDAEASVTTVVEIFDIATGAVMSTVTSTDSIVPAASAIVAATVTAPDDAAAIGYRVRSTLGKFTDGEQSFIPIEAATSDVIDSKDFYLNPGDSLVSIAIPAGDKQKSTLDYTANPAWNIIKELPGLANSASSTSVGAARQLFGAATADGLLRGNKELADVLAQWSHDSETEALTSRLAQNDELKAAVLSSTPWVQAAASDTERMARLSLLFDKKATSRSIAASIATLKKLQRNDGGWSWGEWSRESSLWATNMILQDLGRLNAMGYLPADSDLSNMIQRAIAYYESQIPREAKTDEAFTFITTLFPDAKTGLRGRQIIGATIQHIIGNWKKSTPWFKALEAIILSSNGYQSVARQIIGSLSEFAVTSPDKGTSFPSVDNVNDYADLLYAFGRVEPKSKIIDGMRQWLVIRQQTTSRLGSWDPTRLIAAFATTGSDWFDSSASSTSVTLGGKTVDIDSAELATGHIVVTLNGAHGGENLTVSRGNSAVPAYGAVISRYTAASADVKAMSCSDLSIEKRITALRDGRWQYVDDLRLGEQVRIVLTVKAKRDLQYLTVIDGRPAAFEPVEQLPGWVWSGGAGFYRENRNSETRLFIDYLPKGTYQITIDMTASVAGTFSSGIATAQSQLAPAITAHSAGSTINCE